MTLIKSNEDQNKIREAGSILRNIIVAAKEYTKPGLSLIEIDTFINKKIMEYNCTPSFLGFQGFPGSSCLSINTQVVHGIPSDIILKDTDILTIDVGLWHKRVCVDSAITFPVLKAPNEEVATLLKATDEALTAGIKAAKPFRRVGEIGKAIEAVANKYELGIVRNLTGHGVGHAVHESPEIPNFSSPYMGILLKPGMVLAIEPMFTLGTGDVITDTDGWTVLSADQTISAHFEHTVIITKNGASIVT